jgi:hypothetical protein
LDPRNVVPLFGKDERTIRGIGGLLSQLDFWIRESIRLRLFSKHWATHIEIYFESSNSLRRMNSNEPEYLEKCSRALGRAIMLTDEAVKAADRRKGDLIYRHMVVDDHLRRMSNMLNDLSEALVSVKRKAGSLRSMANSRSGKAKLGASALGLPDHERPRTD